MNMKKLGTSGVQVSEMILGCWVMGGAQWGGACLLYTSSALNIRLADKHLQSRFEAELNFFVPPRFLFY